MDIPRGHAMIPLNEADFHDFIYNYYKAEYAPIRSIWSTATAEPRQIHRWIAMGQELAPLTFRPANAQAQKDLESLDFFTRKWNLDASFVRGIVIRYSKYSLHERLEKKLYENFRGDLMVRKALKEKHLIDGMWPSPAPKNLPQELLAQGVQVRRWYGDMFGKYFLALHAVDDFKFRPEVDARIRSTEVLMMVPFVDHLVLGAVNPIIPIVSRGAGYSSARTSRSQKPITQGFGQPDRFDIRFDAPSDPMDTVTRSVVRQCQCLKCGSKRDVTVIISIDPTPGHTITQAAQRRPSNPNISAPRKQTSKASQRYSPGYNLPGAGDHTPRQPTRPQAEAQDEVQVTRPPSPQQKKQCPRCTFLNHPDLTACEMCQGDLPATLVTNSTGPALATTHDAPSTTKDSLPPPNGDVRRVKQATQRPAAPNRNSLSSTLFSIFPFTQQEQAQHEADIAASQSPPTVKLNQPNAATPAKHPDVDSERERERLKQTTAHHQTKESSTSKEPQPPSPQQPRIQSPPPSALHPPSPLLSAHPEMTMLPMTPPPAPPSSSNPTNAPRTPFPSGMPLSLMDDYVPIPSPFTPGANDAETEDAGWGEVSRSEASRQGESQGGNGTSREKHDEEEDNEEQRGRNSAEGMIDLDEVAREEMGVWGERED